MSEFVVKHYINYLKSNNSKFPNMFNPYNESEIKDIAPTLTTNCGHFDSSATVLIASYEEIKIKK